MPGTVRSVRAADNLVQRGHGLLFYTNLSSKSWTFNMQPLRIIVPAEREEAAAYQHEGEQRLYDLSGRLSLKLRDEEFVLGPGDAAHFDAEVSHRLEALGGRDAEIILVACTVPYLLLRSYL